MKKSEQSQKQKQPRPAPTARTKSKPEKSDPLHAAVQAADRVRVRSRKGMGEVYEQVGSLAQEIGLTNLARLDRVTMEFARQETEQIKAQWHLATGGAPLPTEIENAITALITDMQTYTAPLADAAKLQLSTEAAGLPTPFEREDQRRELVAERINVEARDYENGKKSWLDRKDEQTERTNQAKKIKARAAQLPGERNIVKRLKEEGLCKKIGSDDPDKDLSDRQVSRIINR